MNRLRALCLLAPAVGACHSQRGWDWERMRHQPRFDVYSAAMRLPPESTVPQPPLPVETVAGLGRSRFVIYCAACHGAGGYGGSMVAANMTGTRPPSLRAAELPEAFVYQIITNGLGKMPSYAAELPAAERHAVAAYVDSLARAPSAGSIPARIDSLRAIRLQTMDALHQMRDLTSSSAESLRVLDRRVADQLRRLSP